MSSSDTLMVAMLCMAICLFVGLLTTMSRRLICLCHVTGIFAALGFTVSGAMGLFSSAKYVSVGRGAFAFTTLSFRMNAVAAFFVLLIGVVGLCISVYGIGYVKEHFKHKPVFLLLSGVLFFLATMVAVVLAANVFTFLLSWECMSLVSFLLVMFEHERREVRSAGFVYVVMTHIGTAFLTISFLIVADYANNFSFQHMSDVSMPAGVKALVFLCALIGFGTKAGLAPLHIWLPRAHPVAPSHVSALMSGVMIKMALYGFILVAFQFLGNGPVWWGGLVACVGVFTAFLGILHALGQRDQKRMLAFSSIENMGIIFMGLGVSLMLKSMHEPELATFALIAVLVHAFNHALFKSLLFLGAGAVLSVTHTKNMDQLGGVIRRMPWTSASMLVGSMSISAMPPFNGFIGEWMLFQSAFGLAASAHAAWLNVFAVLILGALTMVGALVAMAFVRAFGTVFLALPRSEHVQQAREVHPSMRIGMGALAVFCIVIGLFSSPMIHMFGRSAKAITRTSIVTNPTDFAFYQARGVVEHLSIPAVLLTAVVVTVLLWLVVRVTGKKTAVLREETWACGDTLTPRMTYTASGYSKPIRIAFRRIMGASRTLERVEGTSYFPAKYVYISAINAFAETYVYRPVVSRVLRAAHVVRRIQDGRVQSYLAYLFVTLIIVLLLVK